MRFLATGDIHVRNYTQFSYTRSDGQNSRLHNCLSILRLIRVEARKRNIRNILINGDLFDDANSAWLNIEVFNAVYEQFDKMHAEGLDVVLSVGNHDACLHAGGRLIHSLRAFNKVATVVEKPARLWQNLLAIVPWHPDPVEIKRAVRHLAPAPCLALHCGISGARTGPKQITLKGPITVQDLLPNQFGLVLLSDYHTQQYLARNVMYLGSPLQHSFGEIHDPSIWDVRISENKFKLTAIPTNQPKFRLIRARHLQDAKQQFKRFSGDYFRVELLPDSRLHAGDVEVVASKYGCLVQITRAVEQQQSMDVLPETVETRKTLKAYVQLQVKHPTRQHRLTSLGTRLLGAF